MARSHLRCMQCERAHVEGTGDLPAMDVPEIPVSMTEFGCECTIAGETNTFFVKRTEQEISQDAIGRRSISLH